MPATWIVFLLPRADEGTASGEKSVRKEETASSSEGKVKRGGREARRERRKKRWTKNTETNRRAPAYADERKASSG